MSTPGQVPPLVGAADVADLPGAPFTQRELDIAADLIRGDCGWHIAPVLATSIDLDTDGASSLLLPTLALREVLSVRDRARVTALDGWQYSTAGILERPAGWPRGRRAVTVEFRHGLDEVPLELVSLVAKLARTGRSDLLPGVRTTAKTVGGVTHPTAYTDGDPTAAALESFEHVLARYRVDVPA